MRFVLIGLWAVFVFNGVHATECDECTPLLAHQAGCNKSWDDWGRKIDQALTEQEKAWIVYLPKDGGQYCLTCDLHEETIFIDYLGFDRRTQYKTIQPYINILRDQLLRGLRMKEGKILPQIGMDFGVRDVDLSDCTQCGVLSQSLRKFLCRDTLELQKKGKAVFDGFAQALTTDMWKDVLPRFHRLRWTVGTKESLLDMANKKVREQSSIFVAVGCHGILHGVLERPQLFFQEAESDVYRGTLFGCKLATVLCDLQERYPFSQEDYKLCINYKKKSGWRK